MDANPSAKALIGIRTYKTTCITDLSWLFDSYTVEEVPVRELNFRTTLTDGQRKILSCSNLFIVHLSMHSRSTSRRSETCGKTSIEEMTPAFYFPHATTFFFAITFPPLSAGASLNPHRFRKSLVNM
jgi:hypothetical protein